MVAVAEEVANGCVEGEGSFKCVRRWWRKLQTCLSVEGVAHESSSGVESYAQKQWWRRKLWTYPLATKGATHEAVVANQRRWFGHPDQVNSTTASELEASDKDDDINETNLDLNLGLKTTDGDRETKSRNTKLDEGDQPVKASTSRGAATKTTTNSETHNKLKRKAVPLTLK
ncbi:hypothetical protein GW17_00025294 [Ensete ventricosum]|nr:hypothetical protein GW17_00025294 [Ensete ventricosum]